MKIWRLASGGALACAALALPPTPSASAGFDTAPAPTLTVTTSTTGLLFFPVETVTFSGAGWCGPAYHPVIDPIRGGVPWADVTCGDTVFVGLWSPGPSGGGAWAESATFQSSPGGVMVNAASVGTISGSLTVGCGSPNAQLYAYDLTQGTVLTSIAVPYFACHGIRFPYPIVLDEAPSSAAPAAEGAATEKAQ